MAKNLPAMQESWVQSLGWDDPLENGMATYCSILAWRIPWTKEPGGLLTMGCRVRCNWATITFTDYPYVFINTYLYLDLSQPLKADPASSPHLQFVSIRGLQTRIFICLFVVCVSAGQELRIIFAFLKGCLKKNHTHTNTHKTVQQRPYMIYKVRNIYHLVLCRKACSPGSQGLLGLSYMAWFMVILSLHPYSHPVK